MKSAKSKCIMLTVILFAMTLVVSWGNRAQMQAIPAIHTVPDGWIPLFDGETLDGWEIVRYGDEGEPHVENGILILPKAVRGTMTGVRWVGDSLPAINYAIYYEARRVEGFDIFAALTFPYGDTYGSLIFSGWGGIVNGLSSINGDDASENETTQHFSFRNNQWYPVRLRVTTDSIRAYIGKDEIVRLATAGKIIHLRDDILDTGLTLWTYLSTGEIRNMRIKKIR